MNFYDTCALLSLQEKAFEDTFLISSVTLQELEHIKTSATKDAETKYCARKVVHLLDEYCGFYEVILYDGQIQRYAPDLEDTNDNRIITCAVGSTCNHSDVVFVTNDLCCKLIAESVGLNCSYMTDQKQDKYCGYREVVMTDAELSDFYGGNLDELENPFELLLNEYLIIKDNKGNIVDQYKYTENGLKKIHYQIFESMQLGLAKPKDPYQMCLMDSLATNKITVVRGPAGVGKSYLSCSYLFKLLEEGKVERIVIFCNTVATMGAAKLGLT